VKVRHKTTLRAHGAPRVRSRKDARKTEATEMFGRAKRRAAFMKERLYWLIPKELLIRPTGWRLMIPQDLD
jgi:hypothetical protein